MLWFLARTGSPQATRGLKSLLAFWIGGAASVTSAPPTPPVQQVTPGGGLSGKKKKKVSQKEFLEAYARSEFLRQQEAAKQAATEQAAKEVETAKTEAAAQIFEAQTKAVSAAKAADLASIRNEIAAEADLNLRLLLLLGDF